MGGTGRKTWRAVFMFSEAAKGPIRHLNIELAQNVSFLNKKRIQDMPDKIPMYSVVEVSGSRSVYIDNDILEIFQDYTSKALQQHIQITFIDIPEVQTMELYG